MKKTSTAVVGLLFLILSCSKVNDVQPINSSESADGRIRPGTATTTWKNKGSYPSAREILYKEYRITPYEVWDGVKITLFRTNPDLAKQNDTLRYTSFQEGFRVATVNQIDTAYDWKIQRGYTAIIFKSATTNRSISYREIEDENGNITKKKSNSAVTVIDDSTRSKIGTGRGVDVVGGVTTKWTYEVVTPLISIGKYKYPVSGVEKYVIGADTKVIDFGDGTKNNIATLSVNGSKSTTITLPYDGVPSMIED